MIMIMSGLLMRALRLLVIRDVVVRRLAVIMSLSSFVFFILVILLVVFPMCLRLLICLLS